MDGIVKLNGEPVEGVIIRSHKRSDGSLIQETTSGSDGTFSIQLSTTDYCYVVAEHPQEGGNCLIYDKVQDSKLVFNYIFIDEAHGEYTTSNDADPGSATDTYYNDLEKVRNLMDDVTSFEVTNLVLKLPCEEWDSSDGIIVPEEESFPGDVAKKEEVERDVPLQKMKDEFLGIYNSDLNKDNTTIYMKLWVDDSGSMTVDDINPEYSDFIDWIQTEYPDVNLSTEESPRDVAGLERWLNWIAHFIEENME